VYSAERWREVLKSSVGEEAFQERIREATGVGLPLGGEEFVESLSRTLGRELQRRWPGRPSQGAAATGVGFGMG
jgi:hypothetical protein